MERPRIILVDDDAEALASLLRAINHFEPTYELHTAVTVSAALVKARALRPAAAVIDLSIENALGVESGFSLLEKIVASDRATRVIVLTGHGSSRNGSRALQMGAAHFMLKPAKIEHLIALLRDAVQQYDLRQLGIKSLNNGARVRELEHEITDLFPGQSPGARRIREELQFAALHEQAVLITGETGTGKGWCALKIHQLSARTKRAYVSFQPMAYSTDLAGSELFGHERGAFTGATEKRAGLISRAHRGTLFLDEIADIPLPVQIMLLHTLQEKQYRRLGSDHADESDFRLLCATNGDIEQAMSARTFRSDLYFRVCQQRIHLPPLRERREDIPLITAAIMQRLCNSVALPVPVFTAVALTRLQSHSWPGNLRELEAVLQQSLFRSRFSSEEVIDADHISFMPQAGAHHAVRPSKGHAERPDTPYQSLRDEVHNFERQRVGEALLRFSGNQLQAAKALGIDRGTLKRILQRAEIHRTVNYDCGSDEALE
jgi:DNA-binding NtrC family response regulator